MNPLLIASLIGITAGVFAGIFGIGGGIIIIPALIYFLNMTQQAASGTSLVGIMIFPVGLLGVWEYYRSGKIGVENFKYGAFIAMGLFIGTYLGAKIVGHIPEKILRKGFSLLMVFIAYRLWTKV